MNRRALLKLIASGSVLPLTRFAWAADTDLLTKAIPSTGELTPVIGLGTFRAFTIPDDAALRDQRAEVLRSFFAAGGVMIDSSPMYGVAEDVVSYGLKKIGAPEELVVSTRVWNATPEAGKAQYEESRRLYGVDSIDIYMLHNVVPEWQAHLDVLRDHKENGRIRYLGVTTSHGREHAELERIMETQPLDFVQLSYNVVDRVVEDRLLPLAREKGIAIQANRPFQGGALFERLAAAPLPGWAEDIGCSGWAQIMLKYAVSHPAVTCAIPGTSQVAHVEENMGAAIGNLPDAALRSRIERDVASLI